MDRYMKQPEVTETTGLSGTSIWRKEKAGEFPRRRRIGPNSVAWLASEIEKWMKTRPFAEEEEEPAGAGR